VAHVMTILLTVVASITDVSANSGGTPQLNPWGSARRQKRNIFTSITTSFCYSHPPPLTWSKTRLLHLRQRTTFVPDLHATSIAGVGNNVTFSPSAEEHNFVKTGHSVVEVPDTFTAAPVIKKNGYSFVEVSEAATDGSIVDDNRKSSVVIEGANEPTKTMTSTPVDVNNADATCDTSTQTSKKSRVGRPHTDASRAKISAANKGKVPWNKGTSHNEATREKIRRGVKAAQRRKILAHLKEQGVTEEEYEALKKAEVENKSRTRKGRRKGDPLTEETKTKISLSLKKKWAEDKNFRFRRENKVNKTKEEGNLNGRKGHVQSEATRKKISETLKKRWAEDSEFRTTMVSKSANATNTDSIRKRISETLKAKWQNPEFRAEMMNKMSQRKTPQRSMEHRRKISEAIKKKWAEDDQYREKALGGMRRSLEERGLDKVVKPKKKMKPKRKPKPLPQPRARRKRAAKPLTVTREKMASAYKPKRRAAPSRQSRNITSTTKGKGSTMVDTVGGVSNRIADILEDEEDTEEDNSAVEGNNSRHIYDLLYGDEVRIQLLCWCTYVIMSCTYFFCCSVVKFFAFSWFEFCTHRCMSYSICFFSSHKCLVFSHFYLCIFECDKTHVIEQLLSAVLFFNL